MTWLIRIGDATSQWVNSLFGGHPNESISGRAYRENKPWRKWIDALLWFDRDHCKTAYLNDVKYAAQLLARHKGQNDAKI